MPTDDVSDLRDVVDAINRLCETMKTSDYDAGDDDNVELCEDVEVEVIVESESDLVSPEQIIVSEVETYVAELWSDAASLHAEREDATADSPTQIDNVSTPTLDSYLIKNENVVPVDVRSTVVEHVETVALDAYPIKNENILPVDVRSTGVEQVKTVPLNASLNRERNESGVLDSFTTQVENVNVATNQSSPLEGAVFVASDPVFDQEPITASFEPVSEMYYTASSEVSLLSDVELPDRVQEETIEGREAILRDDRNGVMAGHVAAMRERFESMTRANTPCPDVMRSVSPSLDLYRNITPSPDHLG